jgi:hypothetical protein
MWCPLDNNLSKRGWLGGRGRRRHAANAGKVRFPPPNFLCSLDFAWLLARLHGAVREDLHGAWVSYLVVFLPFALEFDAHVFVFTRAGFLLPLSLVWPTLGLLLALFITHWSCFLLVQTQRHFFSSPFPLFSTQ